MAQSASVCVTLKALNLKISKKPSYEFCVERLNDFKKYAEALSNFFTYDVDNDDPRHDKSAEIVEFDITKDIDYVIKDKHMVSYEEFSMGVSIALKFKEAFGDLYQAVQRMSVESEEHQELLDDYMEDFYGELDSHLHRVCEYHICSTNYILPMLENWGCSEVDV